MSDRPSTDQSELEVLESNLREALRPTYLLVRRLGQGGMATVFLAREPALKRLVAVKVLSPELAVDPNAMARFQREAQAVAQLSHPNVVMIHSVGEIEDGLPYFVMQYVAGESLAARVEREGPLEVADARRALGEVALALEAAHGQGIIHRDIKPANILCDDESNRVLVSDFGIAAVRPEEKGEDLTRLTATGMAVGTPQYMSPEQLLAEEVTERTDIYGLGLLGYELLTGASPYDISSPREILAAHLRDVPKKLSKLRPDIDPELESTLEACLSKRPEERPTASEVAGRLAPGAGALLEWPPPGLEEMHRKLPSLSRALGVGTLLFAVSMLLMISAGPRLSSFTSSLWSLVITLSATVAIVVCLAAVWRMVLVGRDASKSVSLGFSWLTIAEVLGDKRGDTGALISGSKEYAGLSAKTRNSLRIRRVIRSCTAFLAAAAPVPSILACFRLASGNIVGPGTAPIVVLGPSAALATLVLWFAYTEHRVVGAARKRLRVRHLTVDTLRRLVNVWYESFENARSGQSLGRGKASQAKVGVVTTFAIALAVFCGVFVATPVAILGTLGPAAVSIAVPRISGVPQKVRVAEVGRPYRLTTDPTISAIDAGRALHTIAQMGPTRGRDDYVRPPAREILLPLIPSEGSPFGDLNSSDSLDHIMNLAVVGFSEEETVYLEAVATHPIFDELSVLARASSLDLYGAEYVFPLPESVTFWELPFPRYAVIKQVAYAAWAKAAFELSRGQQREAEVSLREAVSYGLLMMDEGPTLIDNLIGVVVVGIGMHGLEDLYEVTGRQAEAQAISAARDAAYGVDDELGTVQSGEWFNDVPAGDIVSLRRSIIRITRDTTLLRGLRFEMWVSLQLAACSNVRELLFGPDDEITTASERTREQLTRYASDADIFDLVESWYFRTDYGTPSGILPKLGFAGARAAGAALGNNRIPTCYYHVSSIMW